MERIIEVGHLRTRRVLAACEVLEGYISSSEGKIFLVYPEDSLELGK